MKTMQKKYGSNSGFLNSILNIPAVLFTAFVEIVSFVMTLGFYLLLLVAAIWLIKAIWTAV
jgi:hypothetical protein